MVIVLTANLTIVEVKEETKEKCLWSAEGNDYNPVKQLLKNKD